jgi:hypothetical protein
MKVDQVTATVRYSQDSGKGAWKSLEIGAEATIAPNEDWHTAQERLYSELGQQIKALWANGNGSGTAQNGPEKPPSTPLRAGSQPATSQPESPEPDHFCRQHQTPFRRYEKDGRVWYSHKAGNNTWCKE